MFGKFKQRWSDATAFNVEQELRKSYGLEPQVTELPCHRKLGIRHRTMYFELHPDNRGIFVQYCKNDEVTMFVAGPNQEPQVDSVSLPKGMAHSSLASRIAELVKNMQVVSDRAQHNRDVAISKLFAGDDEDSTEELIEFDGELISVPKWNDWESFSDMESALEAITSRLKKQSFPCTTPGSYVQYSETDDASRWFVKITPFISFNTLYGISKVVYVTKDTETYDAFGTWTARQDVLDENFEFISTTYDWKFEISQDDVPSTNGIKEVAEAIAELADRISFGDLRD